MKLTMRVLHSMRIMIDLAQQGERTSLKQLAEHQDINQKYGELVVADLIRAELIKSIRGRRGGYLLGKPAGQITLGDIVRAVNIPHAKSEDPRDAAIEKAFERARTAMWEALDEVTLADAARG